VSRKLAQRDWFERVRPDLPRQGQARFLGWPARLRGDWLHPVNLWAPTQSGVGRASQHADARCRLAWWVGAPNEGHAAPSARSGRQRGAQAGARWPLEGIKAALPTVSSAPPPRPPTLTKALTLHSHLHLTRPPSWWPVIPHTTCPDRRLRHPRLARRDGAHGVWWQQTTSVRQHDDRRQQPCLAAV